MNRLVSPLSNTLALLAVAFLPIQQCMAGTCCCPARLDGVKLSISASPGSCCSQGRTSCCSRVSSCERSCCAGSPDSKSKPCECPGGCAKTSEPIATGPAEIEWSQGNEPTRFAPEVISTVAILGTASVPTIASEGVASAADRCVRLCRFLL